MACAPSEDSDQPGHPPSLIRVFAVCSMGSLGPRLSSCGQWKLWSDWADAQADPSLPWVHMPFCRFCHALAQINIYLDAPPICCYCGNIRRKRVFEMYKRKKCPDQNHPCHLIKVLATYWYTILSENTSQVIALLQYGCYCHMSTV